MLRRGQDFLLELDDLKQPLMGIFGIVVVKDQHVDQSIWLDLHARLKQSLQTLSFGVSD